MEWGWGRWGKLTKVMKIVGKEKEEIRAFAGSFLIKKITLKNVGLKYHSRGRIFIWGILLELIFLGILQKIIFMNFY